VNNKYKIIIVVVSLAIAFAVGRYSTPEKIKTVTQTVTVHDIQTDTNTDKKDNKKVVTVEDDKPTGEKVITTTTTDNSDTNTKIDQTDDTTTNTTSTKEVTKGSDKVTILGLAGTQFGKGSPLSTVYGGSISKPVLGPITTGAWGLSNKTVGLSVGLTF
jgi:hypothetical protein